MGRPAVIYAIVHQATGRMYVGKTVHLVRRWHDHRKLARRGITRTHFYSAIRKYGAAQFSTVVLEEHPSEASALEAETWWIQYLKSLGVTLYNENEGGRGGTSPTAATRQRMSESARASKARSPMTADGRRRIAEANASRVISDETRRKLAEASARTLNLMRRCA